MAISGKQDIVVGVENQATGSDDLYTAFRKVVNNFDTLYESASPYTEFAAGNGIATTQSANTVRITNTGVVTLNPGTGISLSGTTGNVTISVSGDASGNIIAGVTNVAVVSTTLDVSGSPVISRGNISVNLPAFANTSAFSPGSYVSPTLTVDQYGRITEISNISTAGTVTSVAVTATGPGIAIVGSPITRSGIIEITNTGVTRINAGPGVSLSGSTGNITIATVNATYGTVTRIDVTSTSMVVTGGPVTSIGTVNIELPSNVTFNQVTASSIVSSGAFVTTGNVSGANINTGGNLSVTGNAVVGNIAATTLSGHLVGNVDGRIGATTPNTGAFTTITASGNATVSGNVNAGNLVTSGVANITGNATVGNLTTAGAIVSTGTITSSANVQGANLLTGGMVYGASYVQSGGILYAPQGHLIINTAMPTQNVLPGSIAIDQANSILGVYYAGAWHYVSLSA